MWLDGARLKDYTLSQQAMSVRIPAAGSWEMLLFFLSLKFPPFTLGLAECVRDCRNGASLEAGPVGRLQAVSLATMALER